MRDEQAALDIVQDAMLRLAEKYGHRPAEELPLLFHRIMQNAIRDYYRRQKVRSLWTTLLSSLSPGRGEDEEQDPLETYEPPGGHDASEAPGARLEQDALASRRERNSPICLDDLHRGALADRGRGFQTGRSRK